MRVVVYGSASKRTPQKYLDVAEELGDMIAAQSHVCVNGAGANGVMGALNRGLLRSGGTVVGVAHEKMVDGGIVENILKDRGMELLIAGGPTLAERKRLLAEGADGFISLPGGPGTWEELWEIASVESLELLTDPACARPCILVNVDGFYDGFVMQVIRAHSDGILRVHPDALITVVETAAEAMRCLTDRKYLQQCGYFARVMAAEERRGAGGAGAAGGPQSRL
jgi:uncharacterized protein (TIGR00730 family)